MTMFQINRSINIDTTITAFFESGFIALGRADLKPVPFSLPYNWLVDPFSDRNWMFQLHGWRMLDAFFGRMDQSHLEFIGKIMTDWYQFYVVHSELSHWFWYDMSTGLRASKIACLLDHCHKHQLKVPLTNQVLTGLVSSHIQHLTNLNELNRGNHGLFQLNGLMSLLYVLNARQEKPANYNYGIKFATDNMVSILRSQLGSHGVHTEDAPDYHFFALSKIRQTLLSPWWQAEEMREIQFLLSKAEQAQHWLVTPSLVCAPIGDSAEVVKLKNCDRLREWPHTEVNNSLAAQLDGYAVVRSAPEVELELSHYVFFQGSFQSSGHKHADCLSFIWQEGNRYRLWDSGKYGYQKDAMRSYFQSTRAHNTLEVDGKDFSRSKADGYGSAIQTVEACADGWLLAGKVFHKRLNVTHHRVLYYQPGVGIDVLDKVFNHSKVARCYRFWWHLGVSAEAIVSEQAVDVVYEGKTDMVGTFQSSTPLQPKLSLYFGDKKPRLKGWLSREYLKFHAATCLSALINDSAPEVFFVTSWRLAGNEISSSLFSIDEQKITSSSIELDKRLQSLLSDK